MPRVPALPARPKKTAFVPRSIFLGALVTTSVVPLCACGGAVAEPLLTVAGVAYDGGSGPKSDAREPPFDVATTAFDSGEHYASVAAMAFDGSIEFGVAFQAFDAGADAELWVVAATAFDAGRDAPELGVATKAFDAGEDATFLGVGAPAFDASDRVRGT